MASESLTKAATPNEMFPLHPSAPKESDSPRLANVKGRFAVVIPLYNHGRTVKAVATAASALGWPVYVVDDGSTDGGDPSLEFVANLCLLRHRVNLGKGAALMTGFRVAAERADWAITLDADGQHFPEDAQALIDAIPQGRRPIMLGCRLRMSAEGAPWTSRFGRGFSNFWIRMADGPRVTDSQSGFRIYPLPEVLQLGVRAQRYQFEIEVLVKAAWSAMEVIEAPIRVSYPPEAERESHFRPFGDFWRNTTTFARLITRRVVLRRPRARKSAVPGASR
jgi:glycosyltransferase involved in cell wall biosynthesis